MDIVRYLLNCIALFSPTPASPIASLGLVEGGGSFLAVRYDAAAVSAFPLIAQSIARQTSVAVVDREGQLQGAISPLTLGLCDERLAVATWRSWVCSHLWNLVQIFHGVFDFGF